MFSKFFKFGLVISLLLCLNCAAHLHQVGNGAKGDTQQRARQWYILFGLVPLNEIDTRKMAEDAVNYEIKTETSVTDMFLNILTGYVTITSRTVTVSK